tara:strand:- start:223 stop:879 length:657 start_codon:yes stop_codon:yes gene_type:complete
MSKKITSGKQLDNFLSLLVRESFDSAFEQIKKMPHLKVNEQEEKEDVEAKVKTKEKPAEGDEEEQEKEDVEVKADVEVKDSPSEKDPMERPPASERAPKRPESGAQVKLSNILYDINQIRSGRSLRDPDVRDNLEDYFNRLTNPERMALSEFLEGLTDVIVKGVPAEDAEDPSDEVKMTEPEASSNTEEAEAEEEVEVEEKTVEKPAEDLTPPIQVRR